MKKKVIWGIVIVLIFGIIAWIDLPYLIPTKNLISSQPIDYTYEKITFYNWEYRQFESLNVQDEETMKRIIDKIDTLELRKRRDFNYGSEEITFTARYSKNNMTYVEQVFSISFQNVEGKNYLTFDRRGDTYKTYSYKILNKDFELEKFIEELKAEVK